ncbi:MAG: 30S ribosome-binding factor RbfA [Candidatus Omnitrophica bacterium]|nr:30S ribosome-binding factor RbfA [Candidatus Omnitrophota bacterium]MBU1924469.1 30S ribosome-binding factor RbfA [Candidatus Omnitrophota bacterium]
MSLRSEKVAQWLKEEVSKIIHDEIKDPRIGFLTISKVEISADLRFAKIYYSILGTEEQKKNAQQGLKSAYKYIRRLLGERLKIKFTPDICFKLDKSCEYSMRMNELFEKIKQDRLQQEKKGKDHDQAANT